MLSFNFSFFSFESWEVYCGTNLLWSAVKHFRFLFFQSRKFEIDNLISEIILSLEVWNIWICRKRRINFVSRQGKFQNIFMRLQEKVKHYLYKGYLESPVTARYWYSTMENMGLGRIFILKLGWIWNLRVQPFTFWWESCWHFSISEWCDVGRGNLLRWWDRQLNTQILHILYSFK